MTSIWKRVVAWFNMRTDKQRKRANSRLSVCSGCLYRSGSFCSKAKRKIKMMVWDDGAKCPMGYWNKVGSK